MVEVDEDLLKCVVRFIDLRFSTSSFQFFGCQNTLTNIAWGFLCLSYYSQDMIFLSTVICLWGQNIYTDSCSDLPREKMIFMYDYLPFICAFMNPFFRNSYIAGTAAQIAMVFTENNAY